MTSLQFDKYHGAGNDFLLLVDPSRAVTLDRGLVAALCDRHRGIGADGLIRLSPGTSGTVRMELHNADGSIAETSGNGLRCAALGALERGLANGPGLTIETDAGSVQALVDEIAPGHAEVRVSMGTVTVLGEHLAIEECRVFQVDVGNPHLVLVAEDLAQVDLGRIGPELEVSLPGGTNVEVIVAGPLPGELRLLVWERGVGPTLACGSGSCAAALAAHLIGLVGQRVIVHNPGGALTVELQDIVDHSASAWLGGPAARIASVTCETDQLLFSRSSDR